MLGLMLTRTHRRLMRESHDVAVLQGERVQNLIASQEISERALRQRQARKMESAKDHYAKEMSRLHEVIVGLEQELSQFGPQTIPTG